MKKIILTIILITILLVSIFKIHFDQQLSDSNVIELVKNSFNNDSIISSNKKYPIKFGFDGYVRNLEYKIVLTKKDYFNPIVTLIRTSYESSDSVKDLYNISLLYYKRINFNKLELTDFKSSTSKKLSLNELLNFAISRDIYLDNPDTVNISIYPPLSEEDIKSNLNRYESELKEKTFFTNPEQIETNLTGVEIPIRAIQRLEQYYYNKKNNTFDNFGFEFSKEQLEVGAKILDEARLNLTIIEKEKLKSEMNKFYQTHPDYRSGEEVLNF
jgi:hypothetical protein